MPKGGIRDLYAPIINMTLAHKSCREIVAELKCHPSLVRLYRKRARAAGLMLPDDPNYKHGGYHVRKRNLAKGWPANFREFKSAGKRGVPAPTLEGNAKWRALADE